ncbi:MAG: hypothetical protein HRU15_15325 [Planctomycetes bacterium]|nr:hypothetical protein [Planctomycetota bacterium]
MIQRSDELEEEEAPILEIVREIAPKAQDMQSYRNFNLAKGQVQRVQVGIITALRKVAEDPNLSLRKANIVPKDGDDPVKQPLYIDSITLPGLNLIGDNPQNPFMPPVGRVVEIVINIPSRGVALDQINKRINEELSKIEIGQTIHQVRGVDVKAKLFSHVESKAQAAKTMKYTFRWDSHMDDDGSPKPIVEVKTIRVVSTTYLCTLAQF